MNRSRALYDEERNGNVGSGNSFLTSPEGMLRKGLCLQQSIDVAWSELCVVASCPKPGHTASGQSLSKALNS